jgi:hypothetical protein
VALEDVRVKRPRALALASLAVFLAPLAPELLGRRLLAFRDAFVTHFPIKLYALGRMRAGAAPLVNFGASNAQPLAADPNTFSFYPTSLLYFVLPPAAAFNAHLLLHVAWALAGAAALARALGASRPASVLGGAAYAFSGPYLSYAAAFSNSAAAAAWAPWAVWALVGMARAGSASRRRSMAAAAAVAFGLQVLAGEPAISAWTAVLAAALALALRRRKADGSPAGGILRPALALGAAALAAAALAAPQILTTLQALPYSFRGEHLFSRAQFGAAANVPARLLEWAFPLVFGAPRPVVSGAFWAYRLFGPVAMQPYLYSVAAGLAAVVLCAAAISSPAWRGSWIVRALAAAAIVSLLLSFGFGTPLFEALWAVPPLRRFRYPIKFVLPFQLALSALAALAADEALEGRSRRALLRISAGAAALLAAAGAAAAAAPGRLAAWLPGGFAGLAFPAARVRPGVLATIRADSAAGLAAMLLLAAAARWKRANRPWVHLAAVLVCLLPSGWRLFVSVPAGPYLRPTAIARAVAGRGRLHVSPDLPEPLVLRTGTRHVLRRDDAAELIQIGRAEAWPLTALTDGVAYSFDTDPDGSYGFLDRVLGEAIAAGSPAQRSRLLRLASVRFDLAGAPGELPGFAPRGAQTTAGRTVYLLEAERPVPEVRAASRLYLRPSLSGAIDLLRGEAFDPVHDAVLRGPDSDPAPGLPPARVLSARRSGNAIEAEISSDSPAAAVFAVTYFRYWKATVDGRPARVEIADAAFCGVRVPPGRHAARLFYDEGPFRAGAALALAGLLAAILMARASRRPPSRPGPGA